MGYVYTIYSTVSIHSSKKTNYIPHQTYSFWQYHTQYRTNPMLQDREICKVKGEACYGEGDQRRGIFAN